MQTSQAAYDFFKKLTSQSRSDNTLHQNEDNLKETVTNESGNDHCHHAGSTCYHDHSHDSEMYHRSIEDKYKYCTRMKLEGNAAFSKLNYTQAKLYYKKILIQLDYTFPEGEWEEKFSIIKCSAHMNLALVMLKLREYNDGLWHCDEALRIAPNNIKALYRRAQCNVKLYNLKEAVEDLDKIISSEPGNVAAQEMLEVVTRMERRGMEQERVFCKAVFEKEYSPLNSNILTITSTPTLMAST